MTERPEASPAPSPSPAAERPLRPFFILWSGQALSLVGSQAVQFALIWWLTAESGSPTILATATLLGLLPQVVLGPIIGTLVDRWDRKRVMFAADAASAVASLGLALLFVTGIASTAHVLAILFVRALAGAFHQPAMMASTSLMVPEQHLTRIQGLNQGLYGLLNIIAAPLGAALLAVLPLAGVMMVDVVTALLAIVPLMVTHVPRPEALADAKQGIASVWSDLVAGLRYLSTRRGHLTLIGMSAAINLLLVPAFALLPLLVLERFDGGAAEFGWLTSLFGAGLLVGGIVLGIWGGFRRRIVTTLAAMAVMGAVVIAAGMAPSFPIALSVLLGLGLIVPLVNGPVQAILQATIAPSYQGRVFTLVGSLAGATAPIGLILAAPVAELFGVASWYVAGGIVCIVMSAIGFASPALMRIEEDRVEAELAPAPAT